MLFINISSYKNLLLLYIFFFKIEDLSFVLNFKIWMLFIDISPYKNLLYMFLFKKKDLLFVLKRKNIGAKENYNLNVIYKYFVI